MPKHVNVPIEATQHLIRQAYQAGGRYQWAREAWKNSQESGATRIEFQTELQALNNSGVARRVIIDNGSGMEVQELREFLTSFGGGGKPIGLGENFGQGFKSSVLPWNPYGVVVISYTRVYPKGSMLWIQRDKHGNYTLKEFSIPREDGTMEVDDVVVPFEDPEHGCDWSKIRPDWLGTGTIMILMGEKLSSDTINGDANRNETARGVIRYLNERILDPAQAIQPNSTPTETKIYYLETVRNRSRRDRQDVIVTPPNSGPLALHQRNVHGLRHYIPHQAISGSVKVDVHGTEVEWHYVPEPTPAVDGSETYISQIPVITVEYQGEAYHTDSSKSKYRQFGITDEIMRRTWMIIRPRAYTEKDPTSWGVLTQASRNILIPIGGGDLPWESWGNMFFDNFPDELAAVRDNLRSKDTSITSPTMAKNLERIFDRFNPRFRIPQVFEAPQGSTTGASTPAPDIIHRRPQSATPGGTPGTRPAGPQLVARVLKSTPSGKKTGNRSSTRGGFPAFVWKIFDSDEAKHLASFNPNDTLTADGVQYRGVVRLNQSHPVFVQEFSFWTKMYPKADSNLVQSLVQSIYGEEAVAHVIHAQRLNGTRVGTDEEGSPIIMSSNDVKEMLTPIALSSSLLGLVNVHERIISRGKAMFGRRSKRGDGQLR